MLFAALLPAFMAVASAGSTANTIKFINHCPYDVFSWTVGPDGSGFDGEDHQAVTIPANTVTAHGMVSGETVGGGISLKLRDLPKYRIAPAGIVQVDYKLEGSKNNLWYDLSAVNCNHAAGPEDPSFCPLIRSGMKVHVENADHAQCLPAWCDADGCHNTYKEHGSWKGEPTFRCDAGTNIVIEFCTERSGPRTFNGYAEPGHSDEPKPEAEPGHPTTNGICGVESPDGATCFGFAHGNCCSQYGWCGFSEAHCGAGCQNGFGNCFGEPSSYKPPPEPSSVHSDYAEPSSYDKPTASYHMPVSSYSAPALSYSAPEPVYSAPEPAYSAPEPAYSAPEPAYSAPEPAYSAPEPAYSAPEPAYSAPEPVYSAPASGYYPPPPVHTSKYSHIEYSSYHKPTPSYHKPTPSYHKPTHSCENPSKSTSAYSKPSSIYSAPSSIYFPPASAYPPLPSIYLPPSNYAPPAPHTIYATHTVTLTPPIATKTVTVHGSMYGMPYPSSYEVPQPSVYLPPYSPIYSPPHTSSYSPPYEVPHPSAYDKPHSSSGYADHTRPASHYAPVYSADWPVQTKWAYDEASA